MDKNERKKTKIQATADLLLNYNDKWTSTLILKRKWNWKHHSSVARLLNELVETRIISKTVGHKGTKINVLVGKQAIFV